MAGWEVGRLGGCFVLFVFVFVLFFNSTFFGVDGQRFILDFSTHVCSGVSLNNHSIIHTDTVFEYPCYSRICDATNNLFLLLTPNKYLYSIILFFSIKVSSIKLFFFY